ncbi:MAG: hypothetical protein U5L76_00170 [Patescibacteria group bacterium]|nr:hypothetical protein [Patescibacteria group bacterium]
MKNKKLFISQTGNFYSIIIKILPILVIIGGFFLFKSEALAWSEPTAGPPGGNIAAPINISASSQTKLGNLKIGDNEKGLFWLAPKDSDYSPSNAEAGQIYYNSDNKIVYFDGSSSSWVELGAGGSGVNPFKLYNDTQTGWAYLKSNGSSEDPDIDYAIKGVAEDLGPNESYGLYGQADGASATSFGIYGYDGGYSGAYAGYFQGKVGISGDLCLNSNCRSTWPSGGGSGLWAENPGHTYLIDTDSNLSLGGNTPEDSVFNVDVNNGGSLVIGSPLDVSDSTYSCGDSICQTSSFGEDNTNCDQDCPPTGMEPSSQSPTENSITISWQADEEHYARIDYTSDFSESVYSDSSLPDGQPAASYNHEISGLDSETTYHYRVVVWDGYNNYGFSGDKTFTTTTSGCGNGTCDAGEDCDNCGLDCGCGGQICCYHDNAYTCEDCCGGSDCSGDDYCCTGIDWQCHDCCASSDCLDGYVCCADFSCHESCEKYGGKLIPFEELGSTALPLSYQNSELINQTKILGQTTKKLSQSLLIPEAKASTEWFENIIPVAQAAAPFDTENNRKLTIYGGVATVINSTDTNTYALEMGKAFDDGLAILTGNKLYLGGNSNNKILTVDTLNSQLRMDGSLARQGAEFLGDSNDSTKTNINLGVTWVDPSSTPEPDEESKVGVDGSDYKYITISGGGGNVAEGRGTTVSGGMRNFADRREATVSGGYSNQAIGHASTVSGGWENTAEATKSTISGGLSNLTRGTYSAVAGGVHNEADGFGSFVSGGGYNDAEGSYSWAGGYSSQAVHEGSFVWSDNTESSNGYPSKAAYTFNVYASGGSFFEGDTNASSGEIAGTTNLLTINPSENSSGNYRSTTNITNYNSNNYSNSGWVTGSKDYSRNNGNKTLENVAGSLSFAVNNSTGTINLAIGTLGAIKNKSTGTIHNAYSVVGDLFVKEGSTVENAHMLRAEDPNQLAEYNGTINNLYGLSIEDQTYGINQWAIYQEGSDDKSYFAGNIGIGNDNPVAKLTINNGVSDSGSSGDGVFAAVDSSNAAISGKQTGSGYAGYFSGNVKVDGNFEADNVGRITITEPYEDSGIIVSEDIIIEYCGDLDGCKIRQSVYSFDTKGTHASRDFLFFYNPDTGWWRQNYNDGGDGDAHNNVSDTITRFWESEFVDEFINIYPYYHFGFYCRNDDDGKVPEGCKLTIID